MKLGCFATFILLLVVVACSQANTSKKMIRPKVNSQTKKLVLTCAKTFRLPPEAQNSQKELISVAGALRSNNMKLAKNRWSNWNKKTGKKLNPKSLQQVRNWLLRQTYLVPQKKLLACANKVNSLSRKEAHLRKRLVSLHRRSPGLVNVNASPRLTNAKPGIRNVNASRGLTNVNASHGSANALEREVSTLENQLDNVSDTHEKTQLELDCFIQKQQNAMQVMSNANKMLSDNGSDAVKNIK